MSGPSDKPGRPGAPPSKDEAEEPLVFEWLPVEEAQPQVPRGPGAGRLADPGPTVPRQAADPATVPAPETAALEPFGPADAALEAAPKPQPGEAEGRPTDEDGESPMPPHRFVPLPPPAAARACAGPASPVPPPAERRPQPRPQAVLRPKTTTTGEARGAAGIGTRKGTAPGWRPSGRAWLAGAGIALAAASGFLLLRPAQPRVTGASPPRARPGELVTLRGENFAPEPAGNQVLVDGKVARVVRASRETLEVEIPATVPTAPGRETTAALTVRSRGRTAVPYGISLYQPPQIRELVPDVALPGETVVLEGLGWTRAASVSFGSAPGEVLEATPHSLRVKLPALDAAVGSALPVVVSEGGQRSAPATLLIGRLPLVRSIEPKLAGPGEVLTVSGRGFSDDPLENAARIGGQPALVAAATARELKLVVPFSYAAGRGEATVEIRVPRFSDVAEGRVVLPGAGEAVPLLFVAVPLAGGAAPRAAVATELGPAFVLSATADASAAERAVLAQRRLNEAAALLAGDRSDALEVAEQGAALSIRLAGRPEPLLEVTDEDAEAYSRGQTGAGTRVSRGRLAAWWLALLKDLARLLASDLRPRHVAAVTADGRLLGELADAARGLASSGVPRRALLALRPSAREALFEVALSVPPAVAETGSSRSAAATAVDDPLVLEGAWSGTVTEEGVVKSVVVRFGRDGGTLSYVKPLAFSVPLSDVQRPRGGVARFSVRIGNGTRYFLGSWDGESLSGEIASNPDGRPVVGSFELRPLAPARPGPPAT